MSDISNIYAKFKEITNSPNADDVPIYVVKKVVKAYEQGRADAIDECYMKAKTMMEELDYRGGRMNGRTHRMYCVQALEFLRQVVIELKEKKE